MPVEFLEEGGVEYLDDQGDASGGLVGKVGQGLTFGFGDELQAGLFSPARSLGNLITGKEDASLSGAYDELLGEARSDLRAAQEQYPITSTALEVGGALGTGVAGAGTKLGRFITRKAAQGLTPAATTAAGRLAGRAGAGAAIGGAGGATYGFGTGEGLEGRLESAKDVGLAGSAIGGLLPVAGAGLGVAGKAVAPKIDEGLREVGKLAQEYNIPLSLDQLTSSRAIKTAQKVSQDLPFSGQEGFRDKQMSAWNKAVTKSFGQSSERLTPEVIDSAFDRLGRGFNQLGKGKDFQLSDLVQKNNNILDEAIGVNVPRDVVESAIRKINNFGLSANKTLNGTALNRARAEFNKLGRKAKDPATKELYRDIENNIVDTLTSGSEGAKKAFQDLKFKYKNLLAVEPLVLKAKGGNISPSLLQNRVARIYGREAARGRAGELGDLARVGKELLPELGGSDTQARALMTGLAGGSAVGAFTAPAATLAGAGIAGATLGANRLLQSVLNRNQGLIKRLLNREKSAIKELMELPPQEAQAIQELVRKTQGVN